jgi:flagellar basal-body rod protein FlgF
LKNIWIPISGAIAQQRNLETIANNVANSTTPGFKKNQLAFREYLTQLEKGYEEDIDLPHKEWAPEDFYRSFGSENSMVKTDGSYTLFQQGQLSPTGNPLDLAVFGKGFFELLTPNGIRYTRKGTFNLGPDGSIVNEQGFFLLSNIQLPNSERTPAGAEEIPKPPIQVPQPTERKLSIRDTHPISINLKGELFQESRKIGQVSITEFKDLQALSQEGNSLFINKNLDNISNISNSVVHQGFLEDSNVNAVEEMASLIKASRHFESLQNVIKTYDTISGKAVNEIGKY